MGHSTTHRKCNKNVMEVMRWTVVLDFARVIHCTLSHNGHLLIFFE